MPSKTFLSPEEEGAFRLWALQNQIGDLDHPNSHYDYRGFWKRTAGAPHMMGDHFPDTFKLPTHPTFSQESQYSTGPSQGGMWLPNVDDVFLAQPKMAVSHPMEQALMDRSK